MNTTEQTNLCASTYINIIVAPSITLQCHWIGLTYNWTSPRASKTEVKIKREGKNDTTVENAHIFYKIKEFSSKSNSLHL